MAEADAFVRRVLTETYNSPPAQTAAERAAGEAEGERERTMTAAQFADAEAARNAPLYTPAFIELMRRDRLSTPAGEIGVLDEQILCGCNDDSLVRMESTQAVARPDGRVDVTAAMSSGTERFSRRFIVARTPQGWRIDDAVGTEAGAESLRTRLERGVPEQEAAMRTQAGSASGSRAQP